MDGGLASYKADYVGGQAAEGGGQMNIGRATAIFLQIASEKYTDKEKGLAIFEVVRMPTHMGITKDAMLCVIWYLLNLCFELPEGVAPPEAWQKQVAEQVAEMEKEGRR